MLLLVGFFLKLQSGGQLVYDLVLVGRELYRSYICFLCSRVISRTAADLEGYGVKDKMNHGLLFRKKIKKQSSFFFSLSEKLLTFGITHVFLFLFFLKKKKTLQFVSFY